MKAIFHRWSFLTEKLRDDNLTHLFSLGTKRPAHLVTSSDLRTENLELGISHKLFGKIAKLLESGNFPLRAVMGCIALMLWEGIDQPAIGVDNMLRMYRKAHLIRNLRAMELTIFSQNRL